MYSLLKPDFNVNKQTNGVKTEVNFKGTILYNTFELFTGK